MGGRTGGKPDKRPWAHWQGGMPSVDTLRVWRVKARKLAQDAGFWSSCDLCKRPIKNEHRFGRIHMRPARAWRGRATIRVICNSCYLTVKTLLDELEMLGARDHLPPEEGEDAESGSGSEENVASDIKPEQSGDSVGSGVV